MAARVTILGGMQRRAPQAVSGIVALASLAGCASLTEKQCRAQDWYQVGFEDGDAGISAARIESHSAACAAYAIEPDKAQYQVGRADGLQRYCTLARGIDTGMRGSSYSGVCSGDSEREFLRGYREGRRLYDVDARLARVEYDIESYRRQLAGKDIDDEQRRRIHQVLRDLEFHRTRLENERRQVQRDLGELEREGYGRPPGNG
jgi:hypothetical protein